MLKVGKLYKIVNCDEEDNTSISLTNLYSSASYANKRNPRVGRVGSVKQGDIILIVKDMGHYFNHPFAESHVYQVLLKDQAGYMPLYCNKQKQTCVLLSVECFEEL
jgi:hypothetical protein